MKKALIIILIFSSGFSYSQNLVYQWDYRFGGTYYDRLSNILQANDNGFLLSGSSSSPLSGDKSQGSQGIDDYWIIKVDGNGSIQWDKTFGGNFGDELYSSSICFDRGYILVGGSSSTASGDKSEPTQGNTDYWIVKTDSLGNKEWDKDFGGTFNDIATSVIQTSDSGFIVGGYSRSDSSGDKTQNRYGLEDYWIVKIDSSGNKLWDKDLGGNSYSRFSSIKATNDGGFILCGSSDGGISGSKSEPSQGGYDYWIMKIDSLGNKIWDKDYGSINDEKATALEISNNGDIIIGGVSLQGISGDKSQLGWGGYDFWIIKTNSLGDKIWDKTFGGIANEDELNNIVKTLDEGFLISGTSYSQISGDKTENNLGNEQTWVLKIDSSGVKQWDKTLHTSTWMSDDEYGYGIQINNGCYVIGNYTIAGIGGDKTQDNWDISHSTFDFWFIKYCDLNFILANFQSQTPICPGTCATFTNLSTNATSYQWYFPGAIPDTSTAINPQSICYNTPGSYDVTLIATNANGSDTLTLANNITVFPYPPPQGIAQSGDTLFANPGAVSYQWYFNGNIIPAATDYFYMAQASGDYNVVCTDGNGCEVEAVIFNVIANVGETGNQELLFFPNPVVDKLEIGIPVAVGMKSETVFEISIYSMLGEKLFEKEVAISNSQVDLSFLQSGVYFLKIEAAGKLFDRKLVKM